MSWQAIVAVDAAGGIGRAGAIPWKFKEDMAFFRQQTLGQHVVMGRRTWQSLGERCLPGRSQHSVIQSDCSADCLQRLQAANAGENIQLFPSVDSLLQSQAGETCWIIGGARLYEECFRRDLCDRLWLTRIHAAFDCDCQLQLPPASLYNIQEIRSITSACGLTGSIELWQRRRP